MGVRSILLTMAIVLSLKGASGLRDPVFETLNSKRFPAIFNFGDSYSDTGSSSATFDRVPYPCGMTFFGKPSGRLCDGRLIIDFLAEKLGLPYLSAYLDAMAAEFKHGANFAVSGSTIKPVDGELYAQAANPLSLNIQLLQFQQFKQRVDEVYKQDGTSRLKNRLPKPKVLSNALYTIDMGSNDIIQLSAFSRDQAHESLPEPVNYISKGIEKLHQLGGRSFLIHNVGPLGCLPSTIENYPDENLDEFGCVKFVNEMSQEFNRLLKEKVSELRTKLQDSSVFYVDMYSAKYSLIRNATQLGFNDPFGYCCKDCKMYLIPLWMKHISTANRVYKACNGPSKYISWEAEKLRLPYLSAYLDAIGANFKHGADFAASGTTIQHVDGKLYGSGLNPLSLDVQLLQFEALKERTSELYGKGNAMVKSRLPRLEEFSKALYVFDIGQNDIHHALTSTTEDQARESIPELINVFALAIETLYRGGARIFWIHNTGPIGCLPYLLVKNPPAAGNTDEAGCIKSYNEVAQEFNMQLKTRISNLRLHLNDSLLVYVDIYSAKYSLISEANTHGFVDPLGYCCKHSENKSLHCWSRQTINGSVLHATACSNPTQYISWDSIHYTEVANKWVADRIVDGFLSDPHVSLPNLIQKTC
ncbi:GDSL esterase/lipase At4g01130-like isoform X1 [Silene latifolia]|uniref:GDSL esterase/lipase At4g01130-like isoform X1 n=1 Tax=Silene latifolia TaxID=37657 RepID=UPI003D76F424